MFLTIITIVVFTTKSLSMLMFWFWDDGWLENRPYTEITWALSGWYIFDYLLEI